MGRVTCEALGEAEAGQHGGIGAVVLCKQAEGLGEALRAAREDVGVKAGIADIDAGDYDMCGLRRSCVPHLCDSRLHSRFCTGRVGTGAYSQRGGEGSNACRGGGWHHLRQTSETYPSPRKGSCLRHAPNIDSHDRAAAHPDGMKSG